VIASLSWLHAVAPDPSGSGEDPFSMFAGWETGQLLVLAALVPVAVLVFWFGSRQFSRTRGGLRPRGRPFFGDAGRGGHDTGWRATVARLEELPPTPIAKAAAGPVRIEGTITSASGNLGGPPEREAVWRNRAGARPDSAVGAEVIVVADPSGRCGVENLEQARVIAPAESHGLHRESVSLYLGDRVEVVGHFEPEPKGDDADPTRLVYGTIGSQGRVQVRLVSRPTDPDDAHDGARASDSASASAPAPDPEPEPAP
jgi:hypothetical protein